MEDLNEIKSIRARVRLFWIGLGGMVGNWADAIANGLGSAIDAVNWIISMVFPQAQTLLGQFQSVLDPNLFRIAGAVIFAMAGLNLFLGAWLKRRAEKKAARLGQAAQPTLPEGPDGPTNG